MGLVGGHAYTLTGTATVSSVSLYYACTQSVL